MQKNERWGPGGGVGGNPSARLRAARSMPHWMESRGGLPPPPPPPKEPEPSPNDPDYEVIDVPGQDYSNTPLTTIEVRVKRCELCGASGPSVQCQQCPQQSFCPSCDEMYHRHPKRQSHVRRAIVDRSRPGEPPRPPLPPKGEALLPSIPVPPPRRNKKNILLPGSTGSLKRDTGIVGSIKRIITGSKSPAPPRPPPISRDRSSSLMTNNLDFHRNQLMPGDMENGWARGLGGRVGSMTALNVSSPFGPMMHAQSMAHLACPGCWGWGSQAALHQVGMHGSSHGIHPSHGGMPGNVHCGMHMPAAQPFWYPTWDPRRHRRVHHGRPDMDSSSDDEDQPSPAMSRRSIRVVDSDSDDSFKKSRPHSRRDSLVDIRRRDDDVISLRGGRYDDDVRSLRGHRRDSLRRREDGVSDKGLRRNRRFEETASDRGGGSRRVEDTVSERGGIRRRHDDLSNDDRPLRKRDEDTFSDRGGRIGSERIEGRYRDEDAWERGSRRSDKGEKKFPQDNSWDKPSKKDRYLGDSNLDKRDRQTEDRRQNRSLDPPKNKDNIKSITTLRVPSPTKSSDTISSVISSTSGEDKAKTSRKDRVFSDTGQKRRVTLDSNIIPEKHLDDSSNDKEEDNKEFEDEMRPLGPIPTIEWECKHCTYVNRPGCRVCEVCCKTMTVDTESSETEEVTVPETVKSQLEVTEETKTEPKPEVQQKKKEPKIEATDGTQTLKSISQTSKGTSPPPQSISTQTYDVAGLGVKKTAPDVGWTSPNRSFSRQSVISDTAPSGISPTRSGSPGDIESQVTETRPIRKPELTSVLTRKPSKAGSLTNEQISTIVQKQVSQGLEMVKLLREAEEVGFSGEEVSVAVEHCGDSSPLQWLLENWTPMIDTVVTLATNYGHERKENTIGTVSEREARAALISHQGSVWSAVTEVVQQRQNKYGELLSRGNFSREDIVTALTAHHGDLDGAYTELTKGQLKPFIRRMWAPNNNMGELEEQRAEFDTAGRVQSWLTQHVYQSIPGPKHQSQIQTNRRHSDVYRFLNDVLEAQTSQSVIGDNRYASLRSLVGKADKSHMDRNFGAPPERYTSCLNLHEASRIDMTNLTGSRLYAKQQSPSYNIRNYDIGNKSRSIEKHISIPDHLEEYKEKIMLLDNQSSINDSYSFLGYDPRTMQRSQWKNTDLSTGTSSLIRSDSHTDDRSEFFDSKSEEIQKEDEEEMHDEIYNGRLQLLIQRNNKRKRRNRRTVKNYHGKFNMKSDVKYSNKNQSNKKVDSMALITEEYRAKNSSQDENKTKKDSTDEYESIESSEDETLNNKNLIPDNNTILRKPIPKNERIIIIERESSEPEDIKIAETENLTTNQETITLDIPSDKESTSKSHSEIQATDYKEQEGSISNSIPYIDDEEIFSDASENLLSKTVKAVKSLKCKGENKSNDSSKYLSPNETSENERGRLLNSKNIPNTPQEIKDIKIISPERKERIEMSKIAQADGKVYVGSKDKLFKTNSEDSDNSNAVKSGSEKNQQELEQMDDSSEDEYIEIKQESFLDINQNKYVTEPKRQVDDNFEKIENSTQESIIKNVNEDPNKSISDYKGINEQNGIVNKHDNNKRDSTTVENNQEMFHIVEATNQNELIRENVEANNVQQLINNVEENGEAKITVINKATDEIEKGHSDEIVHEKLDSHSEEVSTDDLSRPSIFASGNLKTKIRNDANRLSPVVDVDESSDRDVSPIPTDSEGDKSRNKTKEKLDSKVESAGPVVDKREEMVTLIRESLSRDAVLDRLVGTLLGVLQGGGATNIIKEEGLSALLHKEEVRTVKEVAVSGVDGLVSAYEVVQDINLDPKRVMDETIFQYNTIRQADVIKDEIQIKNEEFQREVRKILAEGLVTSYSQAELAVNLIELKFSPEEAVQAAAECTSVQSAISFLHQECPLCTNKCTIKQMVGLLECDHRCCKDCAFNYFSLQITEGSVWDCVCPFCRLPDLKTSSQDQAQLYFSHLDILLKGILPEATHELFQRKLRDWTLVQDPNFKWCTKCSSGFIANPNQKILMCPDCRSITCAICRKPWEEGHEGRSCEQYAQQSEEPENLLDKHLKEDGITCPACKVRYSLARGGCMHMTCSTCKHEFCSGCSKPFLMGDKCKVSEYCGKLGLHSHHPRNCLFYLRDKEPKVLEQLLESNKIDYRREVSGGGSNEKCKVKLLKETDDGGMIETDCSHPVHSQALCRTHYVEHLVRLVRDNKLDPATVMDLTDAQQELRRRGKQLPDRLPRQCDQSYLLALIKIVKDEIPLE